MSGQARLDRLVLKLRNAVLQELREAEKKKPQKTVWNISRATACFSAPESKKALEVEVVKEFNDGEASWMFCFFDPFYRCEEGFGSLEAVIKYAVGAAKSIEDKDLVLLPEEQLLNYDCRESQR